MLRGAKALVTIVGGFAGITGFSSLSSLEWDPSNVWRIGTNNKFYLFTCSSIPKEDEIKKGSNENWNRSSLNVYLTVKNGVSPIGPNTQLQLWGEGHYTKGQGSKVISRSQGNEEFSLHENNDQESDQTRFQLTVNKDSKKNRLGEVGAGETAVNYGFMIFCNKKLFKFSDYSEGGEKDAKLDKVSFTLKKEDGEWQNKYDGHQVYSVEIKGDGAHGLQWADEFKPIVVI